MVNIAIFVLKVHSPDLKVHPTLLLINFGLIENQRPVGLSKDQEMM